MGKRELVACLICLPGVIVERLFLTVPWGCLRFVIVIFSDRIHLLFLGLFFQERSFRIAASSSECKRVWIKHS